MKEQNFNSLTDKIIRPGIEEKLIPLCLFRGKVSLGDVHRKWNLIISAMEAECDHIGELVVFSQSADRSHLCEPPKKMQHMGLRGFLSRMALNPDVTNNIPGLLEYVRHVNPHPFQIPPISLYGERVRVPWRTEARKSKEKRYTPIGSKQALFYPYVIHKPVNGDAEYEMMMTVNKSVSKAIPDFLRADICQDLIVSILCGETKVSDIGDSMKEATRKVMRMHPQKYGPISLDAPIYADDSRTFGEMIDSEAFHF